MKQTFYLFDQSVKSFDDAIKASKVSGDFAYEEVEITEVLPFEARAYLQANKATKPKWIKFFSSSLALPEHLENQTNSLLFFFKVRNRFFAITAGYGFSAINRENIEPDFGLRVTLNSIDPEKIKGVDARRIDNKATQKRMLVNAHSALGEFDFSLDEDLINLVAGTPRDTEFASALVGSDSLRLTGDFSLAELEGICEKLIKAFRAKDYQENFAFIDHLRVVKNDALKATLDDSLATAVASRQKDKLLLAYPEVDYWNNAEKFKVTANYKKAEFDEVNLERVYDFLDEHDITEIDPKSITIVGLTGDDQPATARRTFYDYAVFETDHKAQRYLLSSKKWFALASDYVEEIDKAVAKIPELPAGYLPNALSGEKEGDYNRRVANKNRVCLDKKNFTKLPGRSSVEVCDLLTNDLHFIAVKRYNGSSTLSHLFSQVYVSSELFHDLPEYRQYVEKAMPAKWGALFDAATPEYSSITFVYAISDAPKGRVARSLPFFSKVNLRHFTRAVERMGYKVKIARINVDEAE